MDQIALVTEQVEDGRRFVDRLVREGIDVTSAGWLRLADESGQWFLYVATPIADEDPLKAYRRVLALMRQMTRPFWVDPLGVKLISPTSPVAEWISGITQSYPSRDVIHYGRSISGSPDVEVEEAFVYPPRSSVAPK